jgi:hypothetical protein
MLFRRPPYNNTGAPADAYLELRMEMLAVSSFQQPASMRERQSEVHLEKGVLV